MLQDRQIGIDRAIGAELLECLPPQWDRARLLASREKAAGLPAVSIEGPGAEEATVSQALFGHVVELFQLNDESRTQLLRIEYEYARGADGVWSFGGDYTYAD